MKKIVLLIMILFLFTAAYGKVYDELSPEKRMEFAADWLDTGKAFYAAHKLTKSKNCFTYVIEVYPMGKEAVEARELLKTYFKIKSVYDPEKTYNFYIKSAETSSDDQIKLNQLLMALEIKREKDKLQEAAILYKKTGNNDKAKEYLDKAIQAGLKESEIDSSLK